jgi:hypothetical protein
MDPKFQTSFIPKGTIGGRGTSAEIPTINIFASLATMFFIVTIVLLITTFGYEMYLKKQITVANKVILEAQEAYNLGAVQNVIDTNAQILIVKKLLAQHTATSQLFELLQDSTIKKIAFNNLMYTSRSDYNGITMDVEAQSYNALARQYEIFSTSDLIKNPRFSDFQLTDNGNIQSKFTGNIKPDLVSYTKMIQNTN